MRTILALTVLLLGVSSAAPEPEYTALAGDYFHASDGDAFPSLVEIESSTRRADRLAVAALQASEPSEEAIDLDTTTAPLAPVPVGADSAANQTPEVSLDDLCNALLTSANDNNLPVPFFANLIWQESRLRNDAVSPVGALGIAQFMPQVAMASGLNDPFDPLQAIPASARLLHELREQFGNLGFVAAAYNAGARRVSEWLEHGRGLPRETRDYVARVTGRSAEQWRTTPPGDAALTFVRGLPCREMPAFADLEQAQLQQAQAEQAEAENLEALQQAAKAEYDAQLPVADTSRPRSHARNKAVHLEGRNLHAGKRHAEKS